MSAHHLTRLADAAIDACDATDLTEHSAILSIARLKQIAQKNKPAAERIYVILKSLRRENIRLHAEGMSQDAIDAALKESKRNAIDAVRLAGVTDPYGQLIQLSPDALERIIQPPPAAAQLTDLVADTIDESVLDAATIANLQQLAHISVTNPVAAVKIYVLITRLAAAKSRLDRAAQEMYNNNQRAALLDVYSESRDAQIEMQSAAFDILKQGAAEIIRAVRAADGSVVLHPDTLRQVVRTLAPPMELIY
jgi:hypothetical protein